MSDCVAATKRPFVPSCRWLGHNATIPYFHVRNASLYSSAAFNGNIGTYTVKNPNILPAVSIAYNAGGRFPLRGGIVQSLDLYDYTTHDAFSTSTSLYNRPDSRAARQRNLSGDSGERSN